MCVKIHFMKYIFVLIVLISLFSIYIFVKKSHVPPLNVVESSASREYKELAQQTVDQLVKGDIAFLQDHLSPNMVQANDVEKVNEFLVTTKKRFSNIDTTQPLLVRPAEDEEFAGVDFFGNPGYSFVVSLGYKDKTTAQYKIYIVKENEKIVVGNIQSATESGYSVQTDKDSK